MIPSIEQDAFIECYPSGQPFYYHRPEWRIQDIAYHLSRKPRFAGGIRWWYSLAHHATLAVWLASYHADADPLENLCHDFMEFALEDVNAPAKRGLAEYKLLEDLLYADFAPTAGLPQKLTPAAKICDGEALVIEGHHLLLSQGRTLRDYDKFCHALGYGMVLRPPVDMNTEMDQAAARVICLFECLKAIPRERRLGNKWLKEAA
jgi:hypothetical protein